MMGIVESSISVEGRAWFVGVLHVVMAAAVTIHTLMNKRDVPAAIGWIGVAWLAPVFGALLYVGFGINRVKRRARRMMGAGRAFDRARIGAAPGDDPIDRLRHAIGAITGEEIRGGRVAAVLNGGDEAYPEMLAAIAEARVSVALSTYIFRTDELGAQFIEALAAAHRRGVRTRVLIDGFGGGFLRSSAYHALRARGVPVARFLHSTLPWKMPVLDLRLHKKSLVLDGETAFVGGLNIGAENVLRRHPRAPVRDTHFRVEGPVVRSIEADFDDDWAFTTGEAEAAVDPRPEPASAEAGPARAIFSGPDQQVDQLVLVLLSAINLARRSIRIATPYFVPDEQILTALQLAALRGVAVHVVLPAVNNHRVVDWAAQAHIRPLLQTGCRLWRDSPPFDHTKLMTVDGRWSLIGSANWDVRSLRLNFELTVELYDADLAARLAGLIDIRCIEPITLEKIDGRWFIVKLRDAAARLLMPYI
jgi:cardiolipin synthase